MITSPAFRDKRYAVLGLARSGLATVDALVASGAEVMAWDNREEARALVADKAQITDLLNADLSGYEAIIVSPGVPVNTHPIADKAREAGIPLIGDIELFAQARADLPDHRVVGITGTNGKSTTTALIHHICESAGYQALMGGNIGLPILSQKPLQPNAKGPAIYVLELSSYQIDLTLSLDCDVAVLLNITPDHLDRYDDDFAKYAAAKARLFAMQSDDSVAVFAGQDDATTALCNHYHQARPGKAIWVDNSFAEILGASVYNGVASIYGQTISHQKDWPALQGPHNAENAGAAIAVCHALGLSPEDIDHGLRSFGGLPHRMEIIGRYDGVTYINDSKATNPASAAPALAAYSNIHWIVGGLPKGDDLDECAPFFDHVTKAYTIGDAGPVFAKLLAQHMPVDESEMLSTACRQAFAEAQPGDVVLLSPACASFDQFRDFEARGEAFREVIAKLIANTQVIAIGEASP